MIRRMCDILLSAIIAGTLYSACADPAPAQNVTCATRPAGDKSNACASTAFVNGTSNPKNLNTIRFASQYGGADWCANLVLALADLGGSPGTVIVDNNQTINACSAVATISVGAGQQVKFVSGSNYTLNQTIELTAEGPSLIGTGSGPTFSGIGVAGTTLVWTGAASGDPVRLMNTRHARVADITINCNNVSDCAGIHYDSTNTPNSTQNTLENFTVTASHYGLLIGNRGTSHPTVASCNATPAQSGCYEMDFLTARNFQLFGTCSDLTAEGIHVNSYFALQQSTIDTFNLQCFNIGIRNVFSAGSSTLIRNGNAGSVVGASPVFIRTDTGGATGYNLYNNEDEGAWTYSVHESGCSGSGNVALVYQNNGWSSPVLVDGCVLVTAIANAAGSTKTVDTNAAIISINELQTWVTSGTGTVTYLPTPTNPLTTAAGGLGANNSASNGVPLFAAGTVTMTGTSGTGNFARVTSPTFGGSTTFSTNSAAAISVGPNGSTNPVWQIDASAATQASGLKLTGAAAGAPVNLQVIDSAAATSLNINAKSSGVVFVGNSSTGGVQLAGGGGGVTASIDYGGSAAGSTKLINGTSNGTPSNAYLNLQSNGQFVSIGNTTPHTYLDINANLSSAPAAILSSSMINMQAADGLSSGMEFVSYGAGANAGNILSGAVSAGTAASPTPPVANQYMYNMRGYGQNSGWQVAALWSILTAENWSAGHQGTLQDWYTTPIGSTTITQVMRLQASGGLSIGTTTDGGAGVVLTSRGVQTVATVVASLATCNAASEGLRSYVTDQNTAVAYRGAVTGGGATRQAVLCSNSAWIQD